MPSALVLRESPPPLALVLEAPRRGVAMVLGRLAPLFLGEERELYVADGANCFDPYLFSGEARRRGLDDSVLDRVFVTRAFTIHQLAAVAEGMLPPLLSASPRPAIAVFGLDHLFLEETLRGAERGRVLRGVMEALAGLRREGARMLITHETPPGREAWWRPMLEFGDIRCRARQDGAGGEWCISIERCCHGADAADIQYVASAGNRFVEGVPAQP